MRDRSLWRCARCHRQFANRNQTHTCAPLRTVDDHFVDKPPAMRALFEQFARAVETIGPVQVLAEKTRIAFQTRMSFAQITPRQRWLDGHLVLARRLASPRFRRVDTISARNHVHFFRLSSAEELDAEFRAWLAEAYAVGNQAHLAASTNPRP